MKNRYGEPWSGADWRTQIFPYLPKQVRAVLEETDASVRVEEIRFRAGQPMQLCLSDGELLLREYAPISAEDCAEILRLICENSIYAWSEELRSGFLTLPGGCRVGIAGRAVLENGQIARITDVTSLCIRVARDCRGVARSVIPFLRDGGGTLRSTLVVSPPCAGKTTLLRDLIRSASCGEAGLCPARVGVVDTRYELAGSVRGVPQFDLGPRTDVLSGGTKAEGMRMLLLSMSPELLAADELGTIEDLAAVTEAAGCGVRVLASVHSGSSAMLQKRGSLQRLLASGLFERYVVLSRRCGAGTVEGIYDAALRPMKRAEREGTAC